MLLENGGSGNAPGWRFPTARGHYFHNSENLSGPHASGSFRTEQSHTNTRDTHFAAKDSRAKLLEEKEEGWSCDRTFNQRVVSIGNVSASLPQQHFHHFPADGEQVLWFQGEEKKG